MSKLDDRSATYLNDAKPQEVRVPISLDALCLSSRISHLEGQMAVALDAIRELRVKLEEKEGDHR